MWFAQTAEPVLYTTTTVTTVDSGGALAGLMVFWLLYLAFLVILIVGMWKVFVKAGEEGWKSIIPFYNTYTLFRIAGRNGWGFLLLFIPFVNLIVLIVISIDLAKHFGKSTVFGIVGLWLFSVIGYLILGFGDAKYVGEKHA